MNARRASEKSILRAMRLGTRTRHRGFNENATSRLSSCTFDVSY